MKGGIIVSDSDAREVSRNRGLLNNWNCTQDRDRAEAGRGGSGSWFLAHPHYIYEQKNYTKLT